MLGTFFFLAVLVVGAAVVYYQSVKIPTPSDFADDQRTTVYYSDATTEMGTFSVQNRVIVAGDQIPQSVRDAVVAGEDRSFYENPGINPLGLVRALWNNLRGGDRQGGSSITQQYAERYYYGETISSYRGKLDEAILAIKLDRQQDKDEILENYLNTIYFGRDSYGIETAAQEYFGVPAAQLDVSQAALLAGVIPSPNNFDPRVSPEEAERRWNYVLDGMVVTGALTQAERDAQVFPTVVEWDRPDTFAGTQGYLLEMARNEVLERSPITEAQLDTGGLKIVTSIDRGLQDMAVAAVATLPPDHAPELHTALVTLNPVDGSIVALYGGADYLARPRNAATQDTAQAGSTFKPFTLVAHLESGNSLESFYDGRNRAPVEGFPEGVRNYGDSSFGRIDVVEATAKSVNSVYAAMNVEVGASTTAQVAVRAGLPEDTAGLLGPEFETPANVLGTASPTPLDMAEAYNTFAAGGIHRESFMVLRVEYPDGQVAYQGAEEGERVFAEDVMADTTYAMTQVVEAPGATGRDARAVGHPVAGKTGTSNENRSAWFVGFTRHLTTAVALYQSGVDDPATPDVDESGQPVPITPFGGVEFVTGGSHPLDVWTAFMTPAMQGREVLEFPEPPLVGEPNTPPVVTVPSVVGLSEAEAASALGAAGLSVAVQRANDPTAPPGTVTASDPAGGAQIEQGSTVTIIVSDGPAPEPTPTPEPTAEPEPEPTEPPATEPPPTEPPGDGGGDGTGDEGTAGVLPDPGTPGNGNANGRQPRRGRRPEPATA